MKYTVTTRKEVEDGFIDPCQVCDYDDSAHRADPRPAPDLAGILPGCGNQRHVPAAASICPACLRG